MPSSDMSKQSGTIERIAVFTEILPFSVRRGIAAILRELPDAQLLVIEQRRPRRAGRVLRNQVRELRRNGWRWVPYQLGDVLALVARRLRRAPEQPPSRPGAEYELAVLEHHPRVRWLRVADLHAADCVAALREFAPDLGLSLGAPILKPSVFAVPRLGTLNLHKGKLPDFRGMPPAFWELYEGAQELGCTVHRIDAGLDTGPILLERALPRQQHATLRGAQIALDEVGVELTNEAVRRLQRGSAEHLPQRTGGKLHRKPTLAQRAELARKLRPTDDEPALRRAVKAATFFGYVHVLSRLRARPELVILLYHRVSDELRDRVTIGLEQFHDQMAYIARHHTLVSLEEVASGARVEPRGSRPLVAVTFDDGYLDNYVNAVPILLQERVPATFFVSTGHIGSERPFPHDLHKVGRGLPTMTWDHLRVMRAHGFTIGSHTVHHVDCARTDREELRAELASSRERLRAELGLEQVLFAYPFGRRDNMTPEALEVVKEVGYACCCSAYGGVNGREPDRFNLLRIGVNWRITPLAFRARLAGFQWEGQRADTRTGREPRVAHPEGGM